jgi:hypothetical protein
LEMEMEVVIKDLTLEKQWSQDTRKCILLWYVGWSVVGFCLHIGFVILVCLLVMNIYSNFLWMDGWRNNIIWLQWTLCSILCCPTSNKLYV